MDFPPHTVSRGCYLAAGKNVIFLPAVTNSLLLAAGAALLGGAFGALAALGIHRWSGTGKDAIATILLTPLVVPGVVIGIALLATFVAVGLGNSWVRLLLAHTLICF